MFALHLVEEAGGEAVSIWIPIVILGWFLLMTLVGWQVSRRNAADSHPDPNPSEFDIH